MGQVGAADLGGPARERAGVVGARRQERGEVPDAGVQLGRLGAGGGVQLPLDRGHLATGACDPRGGARWPARCASARTLPWSTRSLSSMPRRRRHTAFPGCTPNRVAGGLVNRNRVEWLMREHRIARHSRRTGRRSLTRADRKAAPAPDLAGRDLTATAWACGWSATSAMSPPPRAGCIGLHPCPAQAQHLGDGGLEVDAPMDVNSPLQRGLRGQLPSSRGRSADRSRARHTASDT